MIGRTVTSRSGCCGGLVTLLVVLFVIFAPAYYAGQGQWPLGWVGAALAYVLVTVVLVGGAAAAASKTRARQQPTAVAPVILPATQGGATGTPPLVTPDRRWVSYDGGDHFVPYTVPPAPPTTPELTGTNLAAELERLAELHRSGALSDEEFAAAKRTVLG